MTDPSTNALTNASHMYWKCACSKHWRSFGTESWRMVSIWVIYRLVNESLREQIVAITKT